MKQTKSVKYRGVKMKKLILVLLALAIAALSLTGCKKQLIDLNYKFRKIHHLIVIVVMKLIAGEISQIVIKCK